MRKIEKNVRPAGESETYFWCSLSANICPKEKWTVQLFPDPHCFPMLLLKWWRALSSSKERLVDLLHPGMGSPLLTLLHVSASHEVIPWRKSILQLFCSLHTALGFAPVGQQVKPQGIEERRTMCSYCLWPGLPLHPTSSSRGEQMSTQVISTCLVVLHLPNAGPGVSVSETSQSAPIRAWFCVLLWQWWTWQLLCYRHWHQHHEFPNSLDVVLQSCWNKSDGVAFYLQALVSTIRGSGSHKTTAPDKDATSPRRCNKCQDPFLLPHAPCFLCSLCFPSTSPSSAGRTTHPVKRVVTYN